MTNKEVLNYFSNSQHIICNDCLEELPKLEASSIDVVVTSPPYNIGLKYNTYQDERQDYLNWVESWTRELYRVLVDKGSFFLNVGGTNKNPYIPLDVCNSVRKCGFVLQNDIVWVKSISIRSSIIDVLLAKADNYDIDRDKLERLLLNEYGQGEWKTYGHFKPINSKRYLNHCHESIFHFTKEGTTPVDRLAIGVPYEHKSNITRWKHNKENNDLRCKGNTWHIPYKTVQSRKDHPAGFPKELVENCIKLHGVKSDMRILDPFAGAGTTLEACASLGVRGIGIELDEFYCNIANERLSKVNYAEEVKCSCVSL